MGKYCKFGNFSEGFRVLFSRNGEFTLPFTDICKSSPSREFLTSQVCILTLFAKINYRENFQIYSNERGF